MKSIRFHVRVLTATSHIITNVECTFIHFGGGKQLQAKRRPVPNLFHTLQQSSNRLSTFSLSKVLIVSIIIRFSSPPLQIWLDGLLPPLRAALHSPFFASDSVPLFMYSFLFHRWRRLFSRFHLGREQTQKKCVLDSRLRLFSKERKKGKNEDSGVMTRIFASTIESRLRHFTLIEYVCASCCIASLPRSLEPRSIKSGCIHSSRAIQQDQ